MRATAAGLGRVGPRARPHECERERERERFGIPMLGHRDKFHLLAAEGWLELGNAEEAQKELDQVGPPWRSHPDVLEIQWHVLARHKSWNECAEIAHELIRQVPERVSGWIHLSFALHELKLTEDAYANLAGLLKKFPDEPVIPYNLACYCCQLGRFPEAKQWLRSTFKLKRGAGMVNKALQDPDLKPLWGFLKGDRELNEDSLI